MAHKNVAGQQCDGTLCRLCTRCSNCKHQKPGTYKKHEHEFLPPEPVCKGWAESDLEHLAHQKPHSS